MRALAVIIVVLSHAGFGTFIPGGLGVTIFFFLSGYLITTLLSNEFAVKSTIEVRLFYTRRFLRLFPPLAISLAVAYCLVFVGLLGGGATLSGFLAQMFYFANYYAIFFPVGMIPDGTGILWSLAVEEHFYIVFPLLVLPLFRTWKHSKVGFLLLVLCALELGWRIYLFFSPDFTALRIYYASDTRFDSILFGAVLALVKNPSVAGRGERAMGRRHWAAFALGVVGLLASLGVRDPFFRETLRHTLQGISLMPIFYCVIRFHRSFGILNHPFAVQIGVLSYSIYLIHLVVIYALQQNAPYAQSGILCFAIAMSVATLYAKAIEKYVDIPLRLIRSRFH